MYHKIGMLTSSNASLERQTASMRADLTDVSAKIDGLNLDVKDVQGAMKVQTRLFDVQAGKLVSLSNLVIHQAPPLVFVVAQ